MIEQLPSITAAGWAAEAAVDRLLNCYLRESEDGSFGLPDGATLRLRLPHMRTTLSAEVRHRSLSGLHHFGQLWRDSADGAASTALDDPLELAQLLLAELAAREGGDLRAQVQAACDAIANSLAKTERYVAAALTPARPSPAEHGVMLDAEQRLLLGHPFHPAPKSSEGFEHADLERYAPELGARFQLHYLAVDPALIVEDYLAGERENVLPAAAEGEARGLLGSALRHWALLPCHPWQAAYLAGLPEMRALINDRLVFLGPIGAPVYPTSSVRTVIDPEHSCFFKLPLSVRITNFLRTNPLDHLRRSLDASRVIAELQADWPWPQFHVLRELGYRALLTGGAEQLAAATAVLFRANPCADNVRQPQVLAALLEPSPLTGEPPLIEALRAAGVSSAMSVTLWLRRYLDLLLPALSLYAQHGVSLEAHVQNTLLELDGGWPGAVYVRDLEGVSISRPLAEARGWVGRLLPEDSPALYSEAEAWHRLQYYVLVNQLSHLIATLGLFTGVAERELWRTARAWLAEQRHLRSSERGAELVAQLLALPTLPAKANLISRMHQRGERPLYVPIPNPFSEVNL